MPSYVVTFRIPSNKKLHKKNIMAESTNDAEIEIRKIIPSKSVITDISREGDMFNYVAIRRC